MQDKMTDNTFYLRGHYPTDTYNDSNTRAHKGISNNGQRVYNDGHGMVFQMKVLLEFMH